MLVSAWCLYHVTEYVGTVTLWSWLGDLTPASVRGTVGPSRDLAGRGRIGGLVTSVDCIVLDVGDPEDVALGTTRAVGGHRGGDDGYCRGSAGVHAGIAERSQCYTAGTMAQSGRALVDPAYARLLLFDFWFSIANGFTATAQEISLFVCSKLPIRFGIIAGNDACRTNGHCTLGWPIGRPGGKSADHDRFAVHYRTGCFSFLLALRSGHG